jgi:hypothetical protein
MEQKPPTSLTPAQRRACVRTGMIMLAIVMVFFLGSMANKVFNG